MEHPTCVRCKKTDNPGSEGSEGFSCYGCVPQSSAEFRATLDREGYFTREVLRHPTGGVAYLVILPRTRKAFPVNNTNTTRRWEIKDETGVSHWCSSFASPAMFNFLRFMDVK